MNVFCYFRSILIPLDTNYALAMFMKLRYTSCILISWFSQKQKFVYRLVQRIIKHFAKQKYQIKNYIYTYDSYVKVLIC